MQEALKKGIFKEIITTEPIESSLPVTMVSQEVMKKISSLNVENCQKKTLMKD